MKAIVHFPIFKSTKLLVSVGEKITWDTPIFWESMTLKEEIVLVAKILHINPTSICKYLKKSVGESVEKGEILAEKKGLFSSCVIKSPISAKLAQIDLKKGTLLLCGELNDKGRKITSPFPGKVKSITKTYVEVEIEGEVYHGQKGAGRQAVGKLYYFGGEKLSALEVTFEVDNRIIAAQSIAEDTLVKLEVLGALGLILLKVPQETGIPWIQVNNETLEKLSSCVSKTIWLRPEEREIIVH